MSGDALWRFRQDHPTALLRGRQYSTLPWSDGNAEADPPALHQISLLNCLVEGITIDHDFLALQETSGWGEVMQMSRRGFH